MNRLILIVVALATFSFAQGTKTWEQSSFDDFEKGTGKGVAIRSNGALELAPGFKQLITTPSTYIWSMVADDAGNVYAATGSPARVYRIAPDGSASIIFEPKELQVQAVVIAKDGAIYAATSPDGKIYRIEHSPAAAKKPAEAKAATEEAKPAEIVADPSYTSSIYFDPKTKYIWDLALDVHGNLYAATGDQGQIFKVTKAGEGTVFFKSDEAHIRVLALDPQGDLIAGSDGSGLVYRISPAGEAFVLYSANKKEITAITLDDAGNIYAAASGEKRNSAPAPGTIVQVTPNAPNNPAMGPAGGLPGGGPIFGGAPNFAVANPGNSEVYQIAPDGSPRRVWASHDDLVYALAFDKDHNLLAGTGNKGRVFAINTDASGDFTDLLKGSANQISAFAKAPNGNLYASSSNLGKIFVISSGPEREGSYDSDVFDARNFSRWGKVEVRGQGAYDLFARSGNVDNPDRNWSAWKKIDFAAKDPGNLEAPPARFVQWRAVLRPAGRGVSSIEKVVLNYRPKNVAPVMDEVVVQPGTRFVPQSKPVINVVSGGDNNNGPRFDAPPAPTKDSGSIGVRWSAHDDNDDDLVYSLFYRGDNESTWKPLGGREKISDRAYSFDNGLLPDGGYVIKVVASDAPAHSAEESLSAEKESGRFEVDNTPPVVADLNAVVEAEPAAADSSKKNKPVRRKDGDRNILAAGPVIHVTLRAADSYSPIKRAEYSLDAGEWQFVEPVGLLSDSKAENYDFVIPLAASAPAGEHVVIMRVYDRFDNMGSAKVIVRSK
jgi:WD40 repeat protein